MFIKSWVHCPTEWRSPIRRRYGRSDSLSTRSK